MTPTLNAKFQHRAFTIGKRRVKPLVLVVHKVLPTGAVVSHIDGHKPDASGWYAQIQCFPKGLTVENTKWL